jgi:hypothetical protein
VHGFIAMAAAGGGAVVGAQVTVCGAVEELELCALQKGE